MTLPPTQPNPVKTPEELAAEVARLTERVNSLESAVKAKDRIIQLKDEQIRFLNFKLFGPKSEKLSPGQTLLLLDEASVSAGEVAAEAGLPEAQKESPVPKARQPRPNHPGRQTLPEHLERREEIIPCHPKDCVCDKCGQERPVIGYETREELACEPAKFFVKVIKREKRGSHCLDEQGVATAPVPAQIVPKSKLSNQFIIEALAQKYQQHLPVYRQCAMLAENHGIELSRKTLTDAILAAGSLLEAVVKAQAKELLCGGYIQADETTVPCQTNEKTGRNHRAYIWEFSRPGGPVVFEFHMGRGRDGPKEFLKGFKGKLQSDGYGAYAKLGEGIIYVGCLTHARRGFVDASKAKPNDPLPQEVVKLFAPLYAVEQEARAAGVNFEARKTLRQAKSSPLMAALKERITQIRQQIPPGGKLAQACDYTLKQWPRLEEYLNDGQVEIDNNWCEGAIRPLTLGRKNWLHIGSEQAGPKVAAIASIVETCRRLDINLRAYLSDVLPKLGQWPINRVAELTPTAWKTAQSKLS
jgi:transposase